MDDHDWRSHDHSRRLHDPSHPMYVNSVYDDLPKHANFEPAQPAGPFARVLLFGFVAVIIAYFGLVLILGSH